MVLLRPTIISGNPSTNGVTPEPICLLCGVAITDADDESSKEDKSRRRRKWIARWNLKTKQHMLVPSHEIEEAYFTDCPRLLSMFCRASEYLFHYWESTLPRKTNKNSNQGI
jgi:hypothetical protein